VSRRFKNEEDSKFNRNMALENFLQGKFIAGMRVFYRKVFVELSTKSVNSNSKSI